MKGLLGKAKQKFKKKADPPLDRLGAFPPQPESTSPTTSHEASNTFGSDGGTDSAASTLVAVVTTQPAVLLSSAAAASSLRTHAVAADVPLSPPIPAACDPSDVPQSLPVVSAFSIPESALRELHAAERSGANMFAPLMTALVAIVNLKDTFGGATATNTEFDALKKMVSALSVTAEALQAEQPSANDHIHAHLRVISAMVQRLWHAIERLDAAQDQEQNKIEEVKALLQDLTSLLIPFEVNNALTTEGRRAIIRRRLYAQRPAVQSLSPGITIANYTRNTVYNLGGGGVHINSPTSSYISAGNSASEVTKTVAKALKKRHVPSATYDGQPSNSGCMEGTRVQFLYDIMALIKTSSSSRMIWVAGMAGTGKTSVAVTLCHMLQSDSSVLLAGTFFCSRTAGSIERTDAQFIVPTLVTVLARQVPAYASAVALQFEADPDLAYKSIKTQVDYLLEEPLKAIPSLKEQIVFLIDALDECSDEHMVAELVNALARFHSQTPVKFLVTSRPEMHIRETFIVDTALSSVLQLHTVEPVQVTADIRLYVSKTLETASISDAWYSPHDVDDLVSLSDKLFIFASTVLRYILDRGSPNGRRERLEKVTRVGSASIAATARLDAIYELIISEATRSDKVDDDELLATRRVVACILAARSPLSIEALAELLDIQEEDFRGSLERLHSVIYIPSDNTTTGVRALHTSFGDYLFDRAADPLRIVTWMGDDALARGCLRAMTLRLCFNIAQSQSSYTANLPIKPHAITLSLEYACLQWIYHVAQHPQPSTFDEEIKHTVRPRLLFWLEVMSLLGQVRPRAAAMLLLAAATVGSSELSHFLRDANSFVASSHEAIQRSAPHIYLSALPFVSKDSCIYRDFGHLCSGVVFVEPFGTNRHGGSLVMTLTGHEDRVQSVAYSSDGLLLASGSTDRTVRLWDIRTGQEIMSPLQCHQDLGLPLPLGNDGVVCCVVFTPNGKHVIAGTAGGIVHVWDIRTGRATFPPLSGHSGSVWSVSCAPNGGLIASASQDASIRLWNTATGSQISFLTGHTDEVRAVVFSPDGERLATCSHDETARLWKVNTGEPAGQPLRGPECFLLSVSFSPDGTKIAASGEDGSIALWDSVTGRNITTLRPHSEYIYAVRFSPSGQYLAFASGDHRVYLWDLQKNDDEDACSILEGHLSCVNNLTYSPDGLYIASASDDCTIRIWDSGSGQMATRPLQAHQAAVKLGTVCSDDTLIVSASDDGTVRIWDAQTGEPALDFPPDDFGKVISLAISSEEQIMASVSADGQVRLWDLEAREPFGEPRRFQDQKVKVSTFSPDLKYLASDSTGTNVHVWDVAAETPFELFSVQCQGWVSALCFSHDGRVLAAGDSEGLVHIWDVEAGHRQQDPLEVGWRDICSVSFSPDDSRIVSGTYMTAIVWDIFTSCQILSLVVQSPGSELLSVAYSLDGCFIAAGVDDNTVRLWDAGTGQAVALLRGHTGTVRCVSFAAGGQSIISCSDDKTIRIWEVEAAKSVESRVEYEPLARLAAADLKDGWLVGPSEELLLWLPEEYRSYVQFPPCSLVIGSRRIIVTANDGLYSGEDWTACWSH